jgi:ketosteroid isomerase-like protein
MEVNIAKVLAEVRTAFYAYEHALNQNDVEALINFFWQDQQAVRFGAGENLYGWQQIVEFRQNRVAPPSRYLMNTVITSFGLDYANASTEFVREDKVVGRQSQSWVRTAQGWRIAAAHVSYLSK